MTARNYPHRRMMERQPIIANTGKMGVLRIILSEA